LRALLAQDPFAGYASTGQVWKVHPEGVHAVIIALFGDRLAFLELLIRVAFDGIAGITLGRERR